MPIEKMDNRPSAPPGKIFWCWEKRILLSGEQSPQGFRIHAGYRNRGAHAVRRQNSYREQNPAFQLRNFEHVHKGVIGRIGPIFSELQSSPPAFFNFSPEGAAEKAWALIRLKLSA